MGATAATTLSVFAKDVTGQKKARASSVSENATVRELVQGFLGKMRLQRQGIDGNPIPYTARLEREGRHLHDSELVADALQSGDELVLQPKIDAG